MLKELNGKKKMFLGLEKYKMAYHGFAIVLIKIVKHINNYSF